MTPTGGPSAVQLLTDPAVARVDIAPAIIVRGSPPGDEASLTVTTTDAGGHRWRSSTHCPVGPDGALQLSDPERPWWDMAFIDSDGAPVAFQAPDSALDYELEVTVPTGAARATVRRWWADEAAREDLAGDGWRLRLYRPPSAARGGVLVIPGSTGVDAMAPLAALLTCYGYAAGMLAYMQEPGLPTSFHRIPLEAIDAGVRAFTAAADMHRIGVVAASVGTAVALSWLSGDPAPPVAAVVAISPTSVVWQALSDGGPPPKASSLTRAGDGLPYVPIRGEKLLGQVLRGALLSRLDRRRSRALRMLPAFAAGLRDDGATSAAAIPVERIQAPLLAIAGDDDQMWPASRMAHALIDRRRERGGHDGDRDLILPAAGHFIRPPITPTTVDRNDALISGGTPEGSARGQRAAWDAMLAFLDSALRTGA